MVDEQKIRDIAEEYYKTKGYEVEYKIVFYDEEEGRVIETNQYFPEDLLQKMRVIKDEKGMDYLLSHLDEVDDDPDVRYDYNLLGEVYSIDLDKPKKFYKHLFCKKFFLGEKGFESKYVTIEVHPMDYIKLLCLHIADKDMNFNRLRHFAPGVYERILTSIDYADRDWDTDERNDKFPYCITMPEIEKDIVNIFAKFPELKIYR